MYRVGIGYDVHKLELENTLILGGVTIPYHKGTLAHSDGDVVIHAICDAILGAASLGDIGHFFPDNDDQYKDINSKILLKEVFKMIDKLGYSIVNVDVSIILEEPKLKDYLNEMKFEISNCIKVSKENINIKATTSEKLGFIGRGEGVACQAITLLTK
ncbi:MAG: 2-C-methyl-D-erythritol 2,4-cyclodiphosphate synthase [Flavobacteriales bacterium]|nr:2-C-methyl-D-erythritol 2,4-cyclodiphosphate synthase [Flavobacteriales bacterium]|tara:strand:+ start:4047 stop:4520 length:474 start_codon:yes stop_codon:yes gene_type:complete